MITGSSTSRAARTTQRSKALTIATVMTVLTTALSLSGCGAAPWAQGTDTGRVPRPLRPRCPSRCRTSLSTGSTQRTLTAGAVTATVDYWSELSMDKWMPGALKPLGLSLVTTITPSDGQEGVPAARHHGRSAGNAAGALAALDPQIDQATTPPGYLVLSPYSYSQQFTVGAVPDEATFVTLELTYDRRAGGSTSTEYAKQTATDTLTVAIAH